HRTGETAGRAVRQSGRHLGAAIAWTIVDRAGCWPCPTSWPRMGAIAVALRRLNRCVEGRRHTAWGPILTRMELVPNRVQARQVVVSVAVFWTCWGIGVAGANTVPALAGIFFVVGLLAGLRFELTLLRVWQPESGESPLRMLFVPSFRRSRMRVHRHLFD